MWDRLAVVHVMSSSLSHGCPSAWMSPTDLLPYSDYKAKYYQPNKKSRGFADAIQEIEKDPLLKDSRNAVTKPGGQRDQSGGGGGREGRRGGGRGKQERRRQDEGGRGVEATQSVGVPTYSGGEGSCAAFPLRAPGNGGGLAVAPLGLPRPPNVRGAEEGKGEW